MVPSQEKQLLPVKHKPLPPHARQAAESLVLPKPRQRGPGGAEQGTDPSFSAGGGSNQGSAARRERFCKPSGKPAMVKTGFDRAQLLPSVTGGSRGGAPRPRFAAGDPPVLNPASLGASSVSWQVLRPPGTSLKLWQSPTASTRRPSQSRADACPTGTRPRAEALGAGARAGLWLCQKPEHPEKVHRCPDSAKPRAAGQALGRGR